MIRNSFLVVFLFCVGMCVASAATTSTADNISSPTSIQTVPLPSTSTAGRLTAQNTPVNLNSANATEIMTLRGIGQVKADAIIAYRQQNGSFKDINDLTKVKGFNQKTVQKIENSNPGRIIIK